MSLIQALEKIRTHETDEECPLIVESLAFSVLEKRAKKYDSHCRI